MLRIQSQNHLLKSINRASFQLVSCQIKCKKRLTKIKSEQKMLLEIKLTESVCVHFLAFVIIRGIFWGGRGVSLKSR